MKIKLVTGFAADHLCGGAAIMRQLVAGLVQHEFEWLSLARPTGYVAPSHRHLRVHSRFLSMRGNSRPWINSLWWLYYRQFWSRKIAASIVNDFSRGNFDLLWVVYDGMLGPVMESLLSISTDVPLHISLHDEPISTATRLGHSKQFIKTIERATAMLRKRSVTVDAVTQGLIEQVFGSAGAGVLVTMDIDPSKVRRFRPLKPSGRIRFGYSGNFYGITEMKSLVQGLERWLQRSDRDWEMVCFGDPNLSSLSRRIEAHGPTDPKLVQAKLADCDCLILPSPLDRPEMMTNLPTKLVSYSELGLPIIAVCPTDSETWNLLKRASLGPICGATDVNSIDECISKLESWNWRDAAIGHSWLVNERFSRARILSELHDQLMATSRS